ncbi:MAG: hypothetical protein Q8O53_03275, partial [Candidatus Moranbacteria bacterium]|nr:hypothetical protein [Candidatus Moranbacteria bacterium]
QWPRLLALFPILFLTTFGGIIIARNFFPDWSIFSLITFDLKDLSNARYYTTVPNFFEAYLLEWNPLVFSLTPITLLGFGLLLFGLFRKNKPEYALQSYELLFFFLLYTVLLIYSNILTTARYSVLLYPLFAFLAALGFWQLCHYPEHTKGLRMKYAITGILLLASLWSLTASSPFYFNYTNTFLPKSSLIHDAWGYGGYEAAQYLNSLPNAKELTVWADYYGVCEFFVGKCLTAYTFDQNVVSPDYYTLTRRGKARYLSRHPRWERLSGLTAYRYYGTTHPDWQLLIGDRPGNFIKVVKVEKNH